MEKTNNFLRNLYFSLRSMLLYVIAVVIYLLVKEDFEGVKLVLTFAAIMILVDCIRIIVVRTPSKE